MQTLPEWLAWAVGGGAGVITWALVELLKKWTSFASVWNRQTREVKRIAVFIVAAVLGSAGFWAQVQLGYVPSPGDPTRWLEALFAIVVSQVVHAGIKATRR